MCAAPNQAERQKCWSARDEFWKCLDENEKEPLKCLGERTKFEGSCSKTWVGAKVISFKIYVKNEKANDYENIYYEIHLVSHPARAEGLVKYFDRRREYLKFKEKLEKGEADPIDQIKL